MYMAWQGRTPMTTRRAMSKCEEITTRREWCNRNALPDSGRCRAHQDGPYFTPVSDDYRVADAKEHDLLKDGLSRR